MSKLRRIISVLLILSLLTACGTTPGETTAPTTVPVVANPVETTLPPETTAPPETTVPPETTIPPTTEPIELYLPPDHEFAVVGLTRDTDNVIGFMLNYANDEIIIFQGRWGLFVYNLIQKRITFSFDLQKAIGGTMYQGSIITARIMVSKDGSTILAIGPDATYFIDVATGTYYECRDEELEDPFDTERLIFESKELGRLEDFLSYPDQFYFERNGERWYPFEGYDFVE